MNTTTFIDRARSTSPQAMATWCKHHDWVKQIKNGEKEAVDAQLKNSDTFRTVGIIIANYAHSLLFELSPEVHPKHMLRFFTELLEQNDFNDLNTLGGEETINNIFEAMKYVRRTLSPGVSTLKDLYKKAKKPEVKEFINQLYEKQWKYTYGGNPAPITAQKSSSKEAGILLHKILFRKKK